MTRWLRRLRDEERGSATVEFALLTTSLFFLMLVGLDFGMLFYERQRLGAAVEEGAMLGFHNRRTLDLATIRTYTAAASGLPSGSVTVEASCNGQATCDGEMEQCHCLDPSGPSFTATTSCGEVCPSGSTSSYYLTIRATHRYTPMVVPAGLLGERDLVERAAVRLR